MSNDPILKALKDFVATSNSGKYKSEDELFSKFPELASYDRQVLRDFVATSNSGKYKTEQELISKFPEFKATPEKKNQVGTSATQKPQEVSSTPQPKQSTLSVGGKTVETKPSATSISQGTKAFQDDKGRKIIYINRDPLRGQVDNIPETTPDGFTFKVVNNSEELKRWKKQREFLPEHINKLIEDKPSNVSPSKQTDPLKGVVKPVIGGIEISKSTPEEKRNTILSKFSEASKVGENITQEANNDFDDKLNNRGFLLGVEKGLKNTWNSIVGNSTGFKLETDPLAEWKRKAEKELDKERRGSGALNKIPAILTGKVYSEPAGEPFNEEKIIEKARELYVENQIEQARTAQRNDFLKQYRDDELKEIGIAKSKEYVTLEKELVDLNHKIAFTAEQDKEFWKEFEQTERVIKEQLERGVDSFDPKFISYYESLVSQAESKIKTYNKIADEFDDKEKKLGDVYEEYDFFRRSYDNWSVFWDRTSKGIAGAGVEIIQSLFYIERMKRNLGLPTATSSQDVDDAMISELNKWREGIEKLDDENRRRIEKVRNVGDFINYSTDVLADQVNTVLPFAAGGVTGFVMTAARGVGGKYGGMVGEMTEGDGRYFTDTQLAIAPAVHASGDLLSAIPTGLRAIGAFKRVFRSAKINPTTRSLINKSFLDKSKQVFKPITKGLTEVAKEELEEIGATAIQNTVEIALGNKDVNVFDGMEDVIKDTATFTGMMQLFPVGIGAIVRRVVGKTSLEKLDKNSFEIVDINRMILNPNVSEEAKVALKARLDKLTKENNSIIESSIKNLDGKEKEVEVLKNIEGEIISLRTQAQAIAEDSTLSEKDKEGMLSDIQNEFNEVEAKRQRILQGTNTALDLMTEEEYVEATKEASDELVKERQDKSLTDFTITDEEIRQRAIEIQKRKQDERQVSSEEGGKPAEAETVSTEVEEDGVQPQEEVKTEEVEGGKPKTESEQTTEEKVKAKENLDRATDRLKNAWDKYKNMGVVFDQNEQWKKDKELVKSLVDFAVANIRMGSYSVANLLSDLAKQGIDLGRDNARFIMDKANRAFKKGVEKSVGVKPKSTEQKRIDKAFGLGVATQKTKTDEVRDRLTEKIQVLTDIKNGVVEALKFTERTTKVKEKQRRAAVSEFVKEVKKRLPLSLSTNNLNEILKVFNDFKSGGDIQAVLDKAIDKVNEIIEKQERSEEIKEAFELRQQAKKNFKKARLGSNTRSTVAKIMALNPEKVALLPKNAFDAYMEVMRNIGQKSEVIGAISLSQMKAIDDSDLLDKYHEKEQEITRKQEQINDDIESLLEDIEGLSEDEAKDKIKDFRDNLKADPNFESVKKLLDIPSNNELLGKETEVDNSAKEDLKEIFKALVSEDIKKVARKISEFTKDPNSMMFNHINFLKGLLKDGGLDNLSLSELNKLYDSVLNILDTGESNSFVHNMTNRAKVVDGVKKVESTVNSTANNLFNKIYNKVFSPFIDLLRMTELVGASRRLKGIRNTMVGIANSIYENNLQDIDRTLMNRTGESLYKSTGLDALAKAQGRFRAIIAPIVEKLDEMRSKIEASASVNEFNAKLTFYGISVMAQSNRHNSKRIGDIKEHFEKTIESREGKEKEILRRIYNEQILPYSLDTSVKVNADGSATVTLSNVGDKVKTVTVTLSDGTKKRYNVNGKDGEINISNAPLDSEVDLVVTADGFLSELEQEAYDVMRDALNSIGEYAKESSMYQNGNLGNMNKNYWMMNSYADTEFSVDDVIRDLNPESGLSTPRSGNLLPLSGGKKNLKMNPFANVSGVVRGVVMQHSMADPLKNAVKTTSVARKRVNKDDSKSKEEKQMTAAIDNNVNLAARNTVASSNITHTGLDKAAEIINKYFHIVALAALVPRTMDFVGNVLSYSLKNPIGMAKITARGLRRVATLKSDISRIAEKTGKTNLEVLQAIAKNLNVSDTGGFLHADMASIVNSTVSDPVMKNNIGAEFAGWGVRTWNKAQSIMSRTWAVKGIVATNSIISSLSDTALKRDIFLEEVTTKFKNITGKELDIAKVAEGDLKYLMDNKAAIDEASREANRILGTQTGSSNPLDGTQRTTTQMSKDVGFTGERAVKKGLADKMIDNVDVIFARFMRTKYSQLANGLRSMTMSGRKMEGVGDVLGASSAIMFYAGAVKVAMTTAATIALKALAYDDEEDEELINVTDLFDKGREDSELMQSIADYQASEKIEDKDLKKRTQDELYKKIIGNKNFTNLATNALVLNAYESALVNIKMNANSMPHIYKEGADVGAIRSLEADVKSGNVSIGNLDRYLQEYGYLYSDEAKKYHTEKELKEYRKIIKDAIGMSMLKYTNSDKHRSDLINSDKVRPAFEGMINNLSKYKTKEELFYDSIVKEGLDFGIRGGAGNLGSVLPFYASYKVFEEYHRTQGKPFTQFNELDKFISDMSEDDVKARKAQAEITSTVFNTMNPRVMSVVQNITTPMDNSENLINLTELGALSTIPFFQDISRVTKEAKRFAPAKYVSPKTLTSPTVIPRSKTDKEVREELIDEENNNMIDMTKETRKNIEDELRRGGY
jgi:hypothetical protein